MKRIFVSFLSVVLLSFSVGSSYVGASQVKAMGPAVGAALSEEVLYEVCLYIGTIVAVYCGGSMAANSDDVSIARVGKAFVDSMKIDEQDIRNAWFMSTTDPTGQVRVLGSEVLEEVKKVDWVILQKVGWQTIEGGGGGGDDGGSGDDDNDGKDKFKKWINAAYKISLTGAGASFVYRELSALYQKWVNGDELTEAESAVFESFGNITQSDINEQWSGTMYDYSVGLHASFYLNKELYYEFETSDFHLVSDRPQAAVFFNDIKPGIGGSYYLKFYQLSYSGIVVPSEFSGNVIDGLSSSFKELTQLSPGLYSSSFGGSNLAYSCNFPVFSSVAEAEAYLKGTGAVTDALNYSKVYRNADWLADEDYWQGQLIDPLVNVGLSLRQLIDLMKALGLSVLQNQFAPQQLADAIKGLMPGVDPELAPEVLPELLPGLSPQEMPDLSPNPALQPDPEKEPIYWPSPDAHPIGDPTPGADPNPTPTPTPAPTPTPTPDPDPEPGLDLDFDFDDAVSDVSSDFSGFGLSLKDKFPFCIPWDIYYLLTKLSEAPKTPVFKLPLYLPRYGIHEDIEIDLSPFESVSRLSRAFLSLLFAFGLIKMTISFIGMIDDNVTT